jgi:hypothetical protein
MVTLTAKNPPVTRSRQTGALSTGVAFELDLESDDDLRFLKPALAVTIVSPKTASGGANIAVTINRDPRRTFQLPGGGFSRTEPGPVHSIQVVSDAPAAGTSSDQVTLTFSGRDRTRGS